MQGLIGRGNELRFAELAERLKKSPLYQRKMKPAEWEQLAAGRLSALPLTTKEDLVQAGPYGILAADPKEVCLYFETSGTNGKPSTSWFTHHDMETGGRQIGRTAGGMLPTDLVLNRFPYAISLPAHLIQKAANQAGAGVVPVSSRTPMSPYPKILELLGKLDGTLLTGLPREMELLAEAAKITGIDIRNTFPSLRGIWVAGELLVEERRKHIEALWGVPVYNMYGSTETANIAAMCEHGAMHMVEEDFHIEILTDDLSGFAAEGDKGRAVITTLSHQGSPVCRYLNGDILSLQHFECPCGRKEKILTHYGRYDDQAAVGDRRIDPYLIHQAVYSLPSIPVAWKAYRKERGVHFELELADTEEWNATEYMERLESKLQAFVTVERLQSGALLDRRIITDYPVSTKPKYIE